MPWERRRVRNEKVKLVMLRFNGHSCSNCLWIDRHGQDYYTCGLRMVGGPGLEYDRPKRISPDDLCVRHIEGNPYPPTTYPPGHGTVLGTTGPYQPGHVTPKGGGVLTVGWGSGRGGTP